MTKKISHKASMMAPLFPQYDQEEEARLLKEARRRGEGKPPSKSQPQKKKPHQAPASRGDKPARAVAGQIKSPKNSQASRITDSRTAVKKTTNKKSVTRDQDPGPLLEEIASSGELETGIRRSCESFKDEPTREYRLSSAWHETNVDQLVAASSPGELPAHCVEDSHHLIRPFDIPEDALPPPRPEPYLTLRPSLQLHTKMLAQAKDEGISVEALALEMLAEGVVLRAWEIIERKRAMRGQTAHSSGGSSHQYSSRNQWSAHRHTEPQNSRDESSFVEPNYNSLSYQGGSLSRDTQGYYGSGYSSHRGYRPRPNNQAWKEDQGAFLEYVRNQERRGRR